MIVRQSAPRPHLSLVPLRQGNGEPRVHERAGARTERHGLIRQHRRPQVHAGTGGRFVLRKGEPLGVGEAGDGNVDHRSGWTSDWGIQTGCL